MNGRNEENLRELFERFVDARQTEEAIEDIEKGEQILLEHPAPQPGAEIIASIKAQVAKELSLRRAKASKRTFYRVAVAAAIIVVASIGIKLFEKEGSKPKGTYAAIIPTAIWESDNIAVDDPRIASLTADVEQIESEVLTLREGEYGGNGDKAVTELEMEVAVASNGL